MAEKVQIGGRLEAVTQDGIVAEARQIDGGKGKTLDKRLDDNETATEKNKTDIKDIRDNVLASAYTQEEKAKLSGIEEGAQKNVLPVQELGDSETDVVSQKVITDIHTIKANRIWIESFKEPFATNNALDGIIDMWFDFPNGKPNFTSVYPILQTINQNGTGYGLIQIGLTDGKSILHTQGASISKDYNGIGLIRLHIVYASDNYYINVLVNNSIFEGNETLYPTFIALKHLIKIRIKEYTTCKYEFEKIDNKLDNESTNPVENGVISKEISRIKNDLRQNYKWVESYKELPNENGINAVADVWFEYPNGLPEGWFTEVFPIIRVISGTAEPYKFFQLRVTSNYTDEVARIEFYEGTDYGDYRHCIAKYSYKGIEIIANAILNMAMLNGKGLIMGSDECDRKKIKIANKTLPDFVLPIIYATSEELANEISEFKDVIYTKNDLKDGYYDITKPTLEGNPVPGDLKSTILDVKEGDVFAIDTEPHNLAAAYILYDANGKQISYYKSDNYPIQTQITIPKNVAKIAINCYYTYWNNFKVKVFGLNNKIYELRNEIDRLPKENGVFSTTDKIVYTLGSSMIMLMGYDKDENRVRTWNYLQSLLKAKKLYNLGLGGATWQDKTNVTNEPVADDDKTNFASNEVLWLKNLVDNKGYEQPDIIICQFTNGYNSSGIQDNFDEVMTLTFEQLEANTSIRKTFYGGARYTIELLNRYFPKATYYISDGIQCDRGKPYERGYEYVNSGSVALEKICRRFSLPFIATSRDIGIVDLYEHGATISKSTIDITNKATANGNINIKLTSYNIQVAVTSSQSEIDIANSIMTAINGNAGNWNAVTEGKKVNLSVPKEASAVPVFNANETGVTADVSFNQFGEGYDGIYLGTDGLHPSEKGKTLIARSTAKSIQSRYFQKQ